MEDSETPKRKGIEVKLWKPPPNTMIYKPYTPEWHRKRYLQEALFKYIEDDADVEVVINDILDILFTDSEKKLAAFEKANALAYAFRHAAQ